MCHLKLARCWCTQRLIYALNYATLELRLKKEKNLPKNQTYIWVTLAVADDGRVLLDVEEVDGNVAPQQHVVDRRLHLQRQQVRRVGLQSGYNVIKLCPRKSVGMLK